MYFAYQEFRLSLKSKHLIPDIHRRLLIETMFNKSSLRRSCGGPCTHCYVTVTPCWRKGPPEKPILCNACGARYLVKRTLDGYMPGQRTKHKRSQNWTNQQRNKSHRSDSSSSDQEPFDLATNNIKRNSKNGGGMNKNEADFFDFNRSDKSSSEKEAHLAACTLALLRYSNPARTTLANN